MYETKEKTRDEQGGRPDGKEDGLHPQDGMNALCLLDKLCTVAGKQHEYITLYMTVPCVLRLSTIPCCIIVLQVGITGCENGQAIHILRYSTI